MYLYIYLYIYIECSRSARANTSEDLILYDTFFSTEKSAKVANTNKSVGTHDSKMS